MRSNGYKQILVSIFTLLVVIFAACGGSNKSSANTAVTGPKVTSTATHTATGAPTTVTPVASGPGHGTMSAKIDGSAWSATIVITASYSNGIISIAGTDGADPPRIISFAMAISGPGTYQIGQINQSNANSLLSIGTATWQATVLNGNGSVTVTTLTSSGASGTFSFTLKATPNTSATGTKTVTDGVFNVTFSSPPVLSAPVPSATAGTIMTAQVDGEAWSGSFKISASYQNKFLSIVVFDGRSSTITFGVGGVAGPGTYSLAYGNTGGSSAIYTDSTGQGWGTAFLGGSGAITITTLTSNRVAGTFSFDAVPATGGGNGTVHVTNGQFDLTF